MGRSLASQVHLIYDAEDKHAHRARAVQRRPVPDRLSFEAIQAVTRSRGLAGISQLVSRMLLR